MRVIIGPSSVAIWLSSNETYGWAHKPNAHWPCSELAGKRIFASFDRNGLNDIAINGRSDVDVDCNEFNAITSDFLSKKLSKDHPCYLVCVGQFRSEP